VSEQAKEPAADQAPGEITSLLGEGAEFSGKLTFEGTVRIDGRFSGEIESEGTLVVGAAAELEADIRVDTVLVQGQVKGDVTATRSIELHEPARVTGKLAAPELIVERGVLFDGEVRMSPRDAEPRSDAERRTDPGSDSPAEDEDPERS
jgi:cytoskeletal protein CcmA (bactofilin family)